MKKTLLFVLLFCSSFSKPWITQDSGDKLVYLYVTNQVQLWINYIDSNHLSARKCLRLCSNYSINKEYHTSGTPQFMYSECVEWYKSNAGRKLCKKMLSEGIIIKVNHDNMGYPYLAMYLK